MERPRFFCYNYWISTVRENRTANINMFTFLFPKYPRSGREIRQHFQNANPYQFQPAQLEGQMKMNQAMAQYTMFNTLMQNSQLGQNGNQWATHEQLLARGAANARQNQMQGWNPSAFTGPSAQQNLRQRVNDAQTSYQEGFGRRDVPAQTPAPRSQPRPPSGMMVAPQQNNPYFIQAPYVHAAPPPVMNPPAAPFPQQTKKHADEVRQQTDQRTKKIAQEAYTPAFTQPHTPPYIGSSPATQPTEQERKSAAPSTFEMRTAEVRKSVDAIFQSLQTSPDFSRYTIERDSVFPTSTIVFRDGTRWVSLQFRISGGRLEIGNRNTDIGYRPVPDTLRTTDLTTIRQAVENHWEILAKEQQQKKEDARKAEEREKQAEAIRYRNEAWRLSRAGVIIVSVANGQGENQELQKLLESAGIRRVSVFGPRREMMLCGVTRELTEADIRQVHSSALVHHLSPREARGFDPSAVDFRRNTLDQFNSANHLIAVVPHKPRNLRGFYRLALDRFMAEKGLVPDAGSSVTYQNEVATLRTEWERRRTNPRSEAPDNADAPLFVIRFRRTRPLTADDLINIQDYSQNLQSVIPDA